MNQNLQDSFEKLEISRKNSSADSEERKCEVVHDFPLFKANLTDHFENDRILKSEEGHSNMVSTKCEFHSPKPKREKILTQLSFTSNPIEDQEIRSVDGDEKLIFSEISDKKVCGRQGHFHLFVND